MNILIANTGFIPVTKYGGTERVIWYLGKELVKMGHKVTYLVKKGSYCDFATVLFFNPALNINEQIPNHIDVVHFNFPPTQEILKPFIVTLHGNINDERSLDINTVFVSKNHAERFGSGCFVYNGMDWDDYEKPALNSKKNYFHFLGNAAWRIKNVKGAINIIKDTKAEKLKVLGGTRLNLNMGFRFTTSTRVTFYGMVGGAEKYSLLSGSKGLIFPVRWHEPFGLAITESLYFGCPVFGTAYGSLPEIVTSDVGFLSAQKTALTAAVENANQFSSKTCHEYALEVFNSKKMAEAYLEKYVLVLNGKQLNANQPKLVAIQSEKFLPFE
ncbi:MAG: glycosyltransferase [Ferruginibacter sp.]|nr:glycosyltransferase [Ferruginibacter sp.]